MSGRRRLRDRIPSAIRTPLRHARGWSHRPEAFTRSDHYACRARRDIRGRDVYAPFGVDHRARLREVLTRTIGRVIVSELVTGFDCETVRARPLRSGGE